MFAWPMFSRMTLVSIFASYDNGQAFNQWDYFTQSDYGCTEAGAELLLSFVDPKARNSINGFIVVYSDKGVLCYPIENGVPKWE